MTQTEPCQGLGENGRIEMKPKWIFQFVLSESGHFKRTNLSAFRDPILETVCETAVVAFGILVTGFRNPNRMQMAWS